MAGVLAGHDRAGYAIGQPSPARWQGQRWYSRRRPAPLPLRLRRTSRRAAAGLRPRTRRHRLAAATRRSIAGHMRPGQAFPQRPRHPDAEQRSPSRARLVAAAPHPPGPSLSAQPGTRQGRLRQPLTEPGRRNIRRQSGMGEDRPGSVAGQASTRPRLSLGVSSRRYVHLRGKILTWPNQGANAHITRSPCSGSWKPTGGQQR